MANGGPGVGVPGCPACRKRLFTMANFVDHLADDVFAAAPGGSTHGAPNRKRGAAPFGLDGRKAQELFEMFIFGCGLWRLFEG